VYNAKATMYSDQTGMFPTVLSEGNKYVMVLHDVNGNSLWAEPMKNQVGSELILTRNWALTRMQQQGINRKNTKSLTIRHQNLAKMPSGHRA
jgi:hypothetical protein